jgi:spore maturation protein CgeB
VNATPEPRAARPTDGLEIAIFGSSLLSSWWNGAATYYRGLVRGLAGLGHHVTFFEPVAYDRQDHRDIEPPAWADVVVYSADTEADVLRTMGAARGADVVIKTSGVGVHDELLERAVLDLDARTTVFMDVDAPATLTRMELDPADPFRDLLPQYDLVVTYGGGRRVLNRYVALGARECHLIYNALDPTTHHRVPADPRFVADVSLLANRLPDREERIEEFFLRPAELLPDHTFLLGGNGWDSRRLPANVRAIGHVGTEDHNAFNCSATMVVNVTRDSMAANGWSPATRVFEAAGAGACLLTDAWEGIEDFLLPGREVLVARDGAEVAAHIAATEPSTARAIGAAAEARVLREHTYDQRAEQLHRLLTRETAPR